MPQENPTPGEHKVTPYAREQFNSMLDDAERRGIETYGTTLETHNGRDAIKDAKEEAIDLWQYLCQIELENQALKETNTRLGKINERLKTELNYWFSEAEQMKLYINNLQPDEKYKMLEKQLKQAIKQRVHLYETNMSIKVCVGSSYNEQS